MWVSYSFLQTTKKGVYEMKKRTILGLILLMLLVLLLGLGNNALAIGQLFTYLPLVVNNHPEPPTPTPTSPGSAPLPGEWHGNGDDFLLDFTVSNDSSEVTDISGTFWCGLIRVDFWISPPSAINNGEFDTVLPTSIEIHGKFETSTTVTGTWIGWAGRYSCGGNWTGSHK